MIAIGTEPKQPRFEERIDAFSPRLSPDAFVQLSKVATASVDFINSIWRDDSEQLGASCTTSMEYANRIISAQKIETASGVEFAQGNRTKLRSDIVSEFIACGINANKPESLSDEERQHLESALSNLDVISDQTVKGVQAKFGRFSHLIENYFSQDKVLIKHDIALRIAEALSARFDSLSVNSLLFDEGNERPGLFHRVKRQQYDGISQLQSQRITSIFKSVPDADSVLEDHIRGVETASMRGVYGYEKVGLTGAHGINDRDQIDSFQRSYILKNGYYMIALTPKEWARLIQDVSVGNSLYGDSDVAAFLDERASHYEQNDRAKYYTWNTRSSRKYASREYTSRLQKNKVLVDEADVDYSSSESYDSDSTYRPNENFEPEAARPSKFENWTPGQIGIFGDFVLFIDAKYAEKSSRDPTIAAAVSIINRTAFAVIEEAVELVHESDSKERNNKILKKIIHLLHPDVNPNRSTTSDDACKYANSLFSSSRIPSS